MYLYNFRFSEKFETLKFNFNFFWFFILYFHFFVFAEVVVFL